MRKFLLRFAGKHYVSHWLIMLVDVGISVFCTFTVFSSAHSLGVISVDMRELLLLCLVAAMSSFVFFMLVQTHKHIIRYSTVKEVARIGFAVFCKDVCLSSIVFFAQIAANNIFYCAVVDMLLSFVALTGVRIALILVYDVIVSKVVSESDRVLIYGIDFPSIALDARLGANNKYQIVGFINPSHNGQRYIMAGKPVYNFKNNNEFNYLVIHEHVTSIIFPSYKSARDEQSDLVHDCAALGIKVYIAPPIDELDVTKPIKTSMKEMKMEGLLGRDEIKINEQEIGSFFKGKVVMVTGAAGSIGSELCRQLAGFGVKKLVLFDNAETPMHNIRLELQERFPDLDFVPFMGDVRVRGRIMSVFETYHPQIVFHAAAYKHVPLMEENPCEAAYVNVIGTSYLAEACVQYCAEKMIMISTDKAVNPTNVMGATKRMAEIYVQSLGMALSKGDADCWIGASTEFVTTRFGNVLGSNGSVIPMFREQIAKGGPVTVTHPNIVRYFMTIPEACRLVMEAATMSKENEIFVFDMGKQVKIDDLARNMIKLSGYVPDEDIKIVYTGLRPGEKLYEEVLSNEENTVPTSHNKIRVVMAREYKYTYAKDVIDKLKALVLDLKIEDTVELLKRTIPEFKSNNSRFQVIDRQLEEERREKTGALMDKTKQTA